MRHHANGQAGDQRLAHAPGTLLLHGMTVRRQREILAAWERHEARRLAREAPPPDEEAPDAPAPAHSAEAPPPAQWLRLWEDAPADSPPLPNPAEVRERKRRQRREALLLRLLAEHGEALGPALDQVLGDLIDARARRVLAEDLPELMAELRKGE
jgi:hypothetical protein